MEKYSWVEAYKKENEERLNLSKDKLCTFGIGHLDDALYGILPNDLIVIGADAGVGKSEIGITMARHNAMRGKKVMFYFLEGGEKEAIARMKWRDITRIYFQKYTTAHIEMDYRKWKMNDYTEEEKKIMLRIESEVYSEYKEKYKDNLKIYGLNSQFTIDDLLSSLLEFYNLDRAIAEGGNLRAAFKLDLMIIDHLQYFDLAEGENEIQTTTKILKEVKRITNLYEIPVVLISHLRKKGKDRGLPDQEDFYGSSNIPKIASTAITIASYPQEINVAEGIYPTFFRICKSRTGMPTSLAIRCDFNLKMRTYSRNYEIYKLIAGNPKKEPLTYYELPEWAKKGASENDSENQRNYQDTK